jgi:hypothetical protein
MGEEGVTVESAMYLLTQNENVDQDQIKHKYSKWEKQRSI